MATVGAVTQNLVAPGGAINQILAKNSATSFDTKWIDAPAGGLVPTAVQTSTPATVTAGQLVLCDTTTAGFTVALPASPATGARVGVKKVDSGANSVTVTGAGGTTPLIDGDASAVLSGQGSAGEFVYDGTQWRVSSTALMSTSGGSGSSTSAADAQLAPIWVAGNWYSRRSVLGIPGYYATFSPAASTAYYLPMYLPRSINVDRLGLAATTASSGAVVRFGTYTMNSTSGAPGSLIADYGTVAVTSGNNTTTALTATAALPKGWFYFALSFNSTAAGTLVAVNIAYALTANHGLPTWTVANITNGVPMGAPYYQATGDASASALAATASAATPQYSGFNPIDVFYRFAS